MATRAMIAFLNPDNGELITTYNHYDGYPENLGKGLKDHYDQPDRALDIAQKGYISYLDPETGAIEAARQEPAGKVNLKKMDFQDAMFAIAEEADSMGADYIYVYNPEDMEWVDVKMYGIRQAAESLGSALNSLKFAFGSDIKDIPADFDQVEESYKSKWENFINGEVNK